MTFAVKYIQCLINGKDTGALIPNYMIYRRKRLAEDLLKWEFTKEHAFVIVVCDSDTEEEVA